MQPDLHSKLGFEIFRNDMTSVEDHGWDEQAQYESDKHKANLVLLKQSLELVPIQDLVEQCCQEELEELRVQEIIVSLQRAYGLQPRPDDRTLFRWQIERLRRQTLQNRQHRYRRCVQRASSVRKFNTSTNKKTSGSITTNPRQGEKGFVLHSADAKANPVIKNISVITRAGNGGSSSEGTGSALSRRNDHHSSNDMPPVILDNQAQVNCTGVFNVLSNLKYGPENIVLIAANGGEMETFMSGSVKVGNFELPEVHYCPDLGDILIVSGSMLDNDDYGYEFRQGKFTVKDLKNDTTVGEGHLVDGNYVLDYLKIPRIRPDQPRLVTTLWNAVCSALHRLGLRY